MGNHQRTIDIVICFIGIITVLGLAGGFTLAFMDIEVPEFLVATTSGGLGSLAALLAKTSAATTATPVTVQNSPDSPVPTEEVK